MPVDERSLACVVGRPIHGVAPEDYGSVVRWHLDDVPDWAQRQVLDTNVSDYLSTAVTDLSCRDEGLARIDQLASAYDESHGASRRPRAFDERPIRLAVQNVIIGLAAFRYDSSFAGLAVSAWQTCEAPHVAVHEGNRALIALLLAECFRLGGTMEVRFDRHPERQVPARLQQFGRVQGLALGQVDSAALHPTESRELMWAVTQMPDSLRRRLAELIDRGMLSVERACYILLTGIWSPVELEFLITGTERLPSILRGGVDPLNRPAFQAELAVCRAAHLTFFLWIGFLLPIATYALVYEGQHKNAFLLFVSYQLLAFVAMAATITLWP